MFDTGQMWEPQPTRFPIAVTAQRIGRAAAPAQYSQPWSGGDRMTALRHVWTAPWQELSDVCAALVGCGHVSGLLMRRGWPLALMLCADRVPIVYTHSEVR